VKNQALNQQTSPINFASGFPKNKGEVEEPFQIRNSPGNRECDRLKHNTSWIAPGNEPPRQPNESIKRTSKMKTKLTVIITLLASCCLCGNIFASPPLPGAIFTTGFDGTNCNGVDLNIYADKHDVYLNGGPSHPGAASLPDGNYYVQVTDPSGACVLGTSVGAADQTPFHVSNGIADCIQLCTVLLNGTATCFSGQVVDPNCGYNDTPNAGGEYKAWVSNEPTFTNNSTKTDNFKVNQEQADQTGAFSVHKFYDTNANGAHDAGEPEINGWQFQLFAADNLLLTRETPACLTVAAGPSASAPDTYTVVESDSASASPGTSWIHTTPTHISAGVVVGDTCQTNQVWMGNVCLGTGGGLTLGFWSNKNGQKLTTSSDLSFLGNLCLTNANGTDYNPQSTTDLSSWLLSATATNMANMLSAQLAAMELNVRHSFVGGAALVYAPCLLNFAPIPGLNSLGFISVNDLMTAANAELCLHRSTPSGNPYRAYQECLKNTLDNANNNQNFVQPGPCSMSFAPLP
jgi:hypothetical protein